MDPTPLLDRITDDEGLTAGLDEPEAMALVQELADRVRRIAAEARDAADARRQTEALCRRARTTAKAIAGHPSRDRLAMLRRLIAEWPD